MKYKTWDRCDDETDRISYFNTLYLWILYGKRPFPEDNADRHICCLVQRGCNRLGLYYYGPYYDHHDSLIRVAYEEAIEACRCKNERRRLYYRYVRMCAACRVNTPGSDRFDFRKGKL